MKLPGLIERLLCDLENLQDTPDKGVSQVVEIWGDGMPEPTRITGIIRSVDGKLVLISVAAVARMNICL